MLSGIDHLVILVSDLETAIEDYRQQGFTVVRGGKHPTLTHNALIGLADGSYLELLAFYQSNPQSKWWSRLALGGGLIAACMQTDELNREIATFRAAGIEMGDPMPLSRVRPDGYHLKWVLSVYGGESPELVPFLIEDETPRAERVPRENSHRNQVTGIDTVTVAVRDLPVVKRWYTKAFGKAGETIERGNLNAAGVRFSVGAHKFDFLAPKSADGPLEDWLRARGPAPFSLSLTTSSGKTLEPVIAATH
ncbi:MAG: VOC family protein [Steroidobacteraceae bacterium]